MKTGIPVYDIMTKDPVIVDENTSLQECAKKMKENDVSSLIVEKNRLLRGIVTEEDFVRKAILENMHTVQAKVKSVMAARVISIEPERDLSEAMELMKKHNIKHLPVIKGKKIIGIVTIADILRAEPDLLELYIERLGTDIRAPIRGICDVCNKEAILKEKNAQLVCVVCESGL